MDEFGIGFQYGSANKAGIDLNAEKRKAVQLEARKAGYTYNEQSGNYDIAPENYKDQAMAAMADQLKVLQSTMMSDKTWNTLTSDVQSGSFDGINKLIKDPMYTPLFASQDVSGVRKLSRDNQDDIAKLRNSFSSLGYKPEEVDNIMSLTQDDASWEAVRNAFPVISGTDGKDRIVSLDDINLALGGAKRTDSVRTSKVLGDVYATGINALSGKLSEMVNAEKQSATAKAGTEQLKLSDMISYLKKNPGASLADYVAEAKRKTEGATDTAEMKNIKYQAEQLGVTPAEVMKQKQQQKEQSALPSEVKVSQYNIGKTRTILDKAGAQNIADVDIKKLDQSSYDQLVEFSKKDQKNIDEKALRELMSIQSAANKLNPEDLSKTTGIADATFNAVLDTLGIDLPDKELVQSSNYNLIKNSITRLNAGTAVTGSEMDRMVKQIGNEFKSDRTVQIKTAETLDNMASQYEGYSKTAPAFYAVHLKTNVENLRTAADKLRGKQPSGKGSTSTTTTNIPKIGQIINGYKYLGGDANNKDNWEKAK